MQDLIDIDIDIQMLNGCSWKQKPEDSEGFHWGFSVVISHAPQLHGTTNAPS